MCPHQLHSLVCNPYPIVIASFRIKVLHNTHTFCFLHSAAAHNCSIQFLIPEASGHQVQRRHISIYHHIQIVLYIQGISFYRSSVPPGQSRMGIRCSGLVWILESYHLLTTSTGRGVPYFMFLPSILAISTLRISGPADTLGAKFIPIQIRQSIITVKMAFVYRSIFI